MSTIPMQFQVDNIKCGGCRNSIVKGLSALPDVEKLRSMGYPETGTAQGLGAAVADAKSFVSCAIGRLT